MSAATSIANPAETRVLGTKCPFCDADTGFLDFVDVSSRAVCRRCGFALMNYDGVWRGLPPERESYYRRFTGDYAAIRRREGRGSEDAAFYLALPYRDLTGRNEWQWRVRATSFEYLRVRILPEIERSLGPKLRVVDLGAGNGWLSYRLALRGHACIAVDLIDNGFDGLGATRHFAAATPSPLCCVQAEMDRLPFAGAQFDLAIFNASFHYSEDYVRTLSEAGRCVRRGGYVVILDSPWYASDASGRAMVEEKHVAFSRQHGTASDSTAALEYLTPERLQQVERACALRWKSADPWYGWKWALRPWSARVRGRRRPSRFRLFWSTVGLS